MLNRGRLNRGILGQMSSGGKAGTPSADLIAPTLSAAQDGTPTTDGTTGAGVTTDEGSGTLYWAVVTDAGSCTDTQLKAGTGGDIVTAGNQAVSGSGAQVIDDITGLDAETTYQIKFLHRDNAGNDSDQASVDLTTEAEEVVDVDSEWSNVVLLVGNNNGADGNTTFIDQSNFGHTMTTNGQTQWDTAQAPTGLTSSILVDGTGDYLSLADSDDWDLGNGDFTIEVWVRFNGDPAADQVLISQVTNATGAGSWAFFYRHSGTVLEFYYTTTGTFADRRQLQAVWNPSDATWYHLAASRNGTNLRVFVDGTQVGSTFNASTDTLFSASQALLIGASGGPTAFINGWIAGCRVTKGTGRYTANFTPPTLPLATGYSTWNANDKGANIVVSNGNLTVTKDAQNWQTIRSTGAGRSSGKYYWEITLTNIVARQIIGAAPASASTAGYIGSNASSWGLYSNSGTSTTWSNNTGSSLGATWTDNMVISVALDLDNGKIWFGQDGTWLGSGDPAAGTNAAFTGLTGTLYPAWSGFDDLESATVNFGATAFTHTAPTGFTGWLA